MKGAVLAVLSMICAGCVSQYKVRMDFSPELQAYFNEIPTIEVDIAAVTAGEADEVKQAGVEKYFAPNSGFRERLQSQTCFFSREDDASFVLPSRAPVWKSWLGKAPSSVLVIASLPHDPSMTPQADPRYLLVKMRRSYILARTINILVEPKQIVRLSKPLSKSSKSKKNKVQESEQWVEVRTRRSAE
ncbi:MAG: hypothetical protein LBG76_05435 [Treponema sp.]|nr:hypothetical protein [Treponema sp.]